MTSFLKNHLWRFYTMRASLLRLPNLASQNWTLSKNLEHWNKKALFLIKSNT